jgi:hypothetical protein
MSNQEIRSVPIRKRRYSSHEEWLREGTTIRKRARRWNLLQTYLSSRVPTASTIASSSTITSTADGTSDLETPNNNSNSLTSLISNHLPKSSSTFRLQTQSRCDNGDHHGDYAVTSSFRRNKLINSKRNLFSNRTNGSTSDSDPDDKINLDVSPNRINPVQPSIHSMKQKNSSSKSFISRDLDKRCCDFINVETKSFHIFRVLPGRTQYLVLIEGVFESDIQERKNFLLGTRLEQLARSENIRSFPSTGRALELLPIELASGEWRAEIVEREDSFVTRMGVNRECSECRPENKWTNKIIRIRQKDFEGVEFAKACKKLSSNNSEFHTTIVFPERNRTVALKNQGILPPSSSPESEMTSSNQRKYVGSISLVAFDGFETSSEIRSMEGSLVNSVLGLTRKAFMRKQIASSKNSSYQADKENICDSNDPISTLICSFPPFELASFDLNKGPHWVQASGASSWIGVGGLSAIVDVEIGNTDEAMLGEGDSFYLLVTTCEATHKVVAVDGKLCADQDYCLLHVLTSFFSSADASNFRGESV